MKRFILILAMCLAVNLIYAQRDHWREGRRYGGAQIEYGYGPYYTYDRPYYDGGYRHYREHEYWERRHRYWERREHERHRGWYNGRGNPHGYAYYPEYRRGWHER